MDLAPTPPGHYAAALGHFAIKAISLTQPWASAIAVGIKQIETRSWATTYRGPLAIHASKRMPMFARAFADAQLAQGRRLPNPLPLGAVVATAYLGDILPTEDVAPFLSRTEELYGDYTAGRFAWLLERVAMLPEPRPARGALGLWEWSP